MKNYLSLSQDDCCFSVDLSCHHYFNSLWFPLIHEKMRSLSCISFPAPLRWYASLSQPLYSAFQQYVAYMFKAPMSQFHLSIKLECTNLGTTLLLLGTRVPLGHQCPPLQTFKLLLDTCQCSIPCI